VLDGHEMIAFVPEAIIFNTGGGPAETESALNWFVTSLPLNTRFQVAIWEI
jgi:hypothetical protein